MLKPRHKANLRQALLFRRWLNKLDDQDKGVIREFVRIRKAEGRSFGEIILEILKYVWEHRQEVIEFIMTIIQMFSSSAVTASGKKAPELDEDPKIPEDFDP